MEITQDLPLTFAEETLIDMHSVLNVMNVITLELTRMQEWVSDPEDLESLIEENIHCAESLQDREQAEQLIHSMDQRIEKFRHRLDKVGASIALAEQEEYLQSRKNIETVLTVLQIRAAEIETRSKDPTAWLDYSVEKLYRNFRQVLHAIEANSRGGYRIVHNIAEHEDGHYFVNFEISSHEGDRLRMPPVFQDVVRDLLANARKYTTPGGKILAGLAYTREALKLVVSDNGRGIPPDEIPCLVHFGQRGSNVSDRPTRGGGFGLTKAYYVTKKFGGRMWIDSKGIDGEGTRVEIRIPCPEAAG